MNNRKRNLASGLTALLFLILAAGSAKVNKLHCGAFSHEPTGDVYRELENYVLLNDGTRVSGQKVQWKSGMLVKDQIRIDDQKFAIRETLGYSQGGIYYGRLGNEYIERIVHGTLNVYYSSEMETSTSTSSTGMIRTTTRMVCRYYVQKGDRGAMNPIANQKDIREWVKDCPIAYEMANKSDKQIRRSIRKDRKYLNEIFTTYNQGCR